MSDALIDANSASEGWIAAVRNRVNMLLRRYDLEKFMLGGYAAALVIVMAGVSTSAEKLGLVAVVFCLLLSVRLLNSVLDHARLMRNINTGIAILESKIVQARVGSIDVGDPAAEVLAEADKDYQGIIGRLKWDIWLFGLILLAVTIHSAIEPVCRLSQACFDIPNWRN